MNAKGLCAVAAAVALGLAACGDDDDDESAGTGTGTQEEQPAPEGPASETVTLTETEFKIEPAEVEVEKAGVVEFKVENAGGVTHALEVESADLEEETEDIAPGESATLKVELEKGVYELYCPIDDHKGKGMTGELRVAGATGAAEDNGGDDDSGGAEAPGDDDSGGAEAPNGY